MVGKRFFFTLLSTLLMSVAFAQPGTGSIKGTIKDETGDPIPFVNVAILQNGVLKGGSQTDFDGKYKISSISPGSYVLKASHMEFTNHEVTGMKVNADKIRDYNITLTTSVTDLDEVVVIKFKEPLIDTDAGATQITKSREDIAKMPLRSANGVVALTGGVASNAGGFSVRGGRGNSTIYFIDGIKVRGTLNLPKSAMESISVLLGGAPASYGDFTSGVVNITTRPPSSVYSGGIDVLSSGFMIRDKENGFFGKNNKNGYGDRIVGLDNFAYNLIEGNLSGPLLKRKNPGENQNETLLGFFLSGNYRNSKSSAVNEGLWRVKEDVRDQLLAEPFRQAGTNTNAILSNSEFLRKDDFEPIKFLPNTGSERYSLAGKLYLNTSPNVDVMVGGQFTYNQYRNNTNNFNSRNFYRNANNFPLNFSNTGLYTDVTWRTFGKFTQRFNNVIRDSSKRDNLAVKNVQYTIMVDYSKDRRSIESDRHEERLFNYGRVGTFHTARVKNYEILPDDNGKSVHAVTDPKDVMVYFTPDPENPDLAAYTSHYYQLNQKYLQDSSYIYDNLDLFAYQRITEELGDHPLSSLSNIRGGNGLLNGSFPGDAYGLDIYDNIGTQFNRFSFTDNSQFRITGSGSADIGAHQFIVGFEYEQRDDRFFDVNPYELWTDMRQFMNFHISEFDLSSPSNSFYPNLYLHNDYNRLNDSPGAYDGSNVGENQRFLDYNVRSALNLDPDGTDFVDVDALPASFFNEHGLALFSADELLQSAGQQRISYYGYTYDGKKQRKKVNFNDFFTDRDKYGNLTRPIAPFQPIYTAAYISDKFAIDDMKFRLGLRADRYDANQSVLKDKFLLWEAKTAGEVDVNHPAGIGSDYVVYVSDIENPTGSPILGYRKDEQWFNAEGVQVSDPSIISSPTGIAPYLASEEIIKQAGEGNLLPGAFTDYKPQLNLSPRISFSFNLTEMATFFAHYDVLIKRPSKRNRLDILDYYLLKQNPGRRLNNPNLQPEKTIDYELGFQQVVGSHSAIKVQAFYRELRDMVQLRNVFQAYPASYKTWGNIDFATVKGLTVEFDLRKKGNVRMNASYTLQFAEGTGSGATSQLNLINSNQPNLRTIYPFSYDQRHSFIAWIDYRYGSGVNYSGPEIAGVDVLANAGANITMSVGSGSPYNAIESPVSLSSTTGSSLKGQPNGSRLPWAYSIDAQFDKSFIIKYGQVKDLGGKLAIDEKGRKIKRQTELNVYLQLFNIFNIRNIQDIYRATGNWNDDGYLSAPQFQSLISQQNDEQSYRDLYEIQLGTPFHLSSPRTVRLGMSISL